MPFAMSSQDSRTPTSPIEIELASGIPGILRPIVPADRPVVEAAYARLSPRSRLQRFWSAPERLGDYLLDRLTNADGVDHVAWCLIDPENAAAPELGGASFWRMDDEPDAAEFSVTVADAVQHRGVGTLLLAVLWILAREAGITRFRAVALLRNTRLANWMRALGADVESDGQQWIIDLPLDETVLRRRARSSPTARRLANWLEVLPERLFPDGPAAKTR